MLAALAISVLFAAAATASVDGLGDPLPTGAIQRLGTLRMRCHAKDLAHLPDGRGVVLTSGYVDIWDLTKGEQQSHTHVSRQHLMSVDVRSDGKVLLLGDYRGRVCEWEVATRKELRHWDTGHRTLCSVRYSPDETRMLTAGNGPVCAKESDLATGQELVCLTMHGGSDRGDTPPNASDWLDVHHNWLAAATKEAIYSRGNTRAYQNACGPEEKLEHSPVTYGE